MKTSKEILQELLAHLNIKANKLSIEIGDKSNSRIYYVRNGRSKISSNLAKAITGRYKHIDYDYLITGKGQLIRKDILGNISRNILKEKSNKNFKITVDLCDFDKYTSYLEFSKNNDFQKVTFTLDQYILGNYKAFGNNGDSMNGGSICDTPSNAVILGLELARNEWLSGFNQTDYGWIILSKNNIFHKDIVSLDKEKGAILCHSRNTSPEYSDFTLYFDDIHQIFKVIKRSF